MARFYQMEKHNNLASKKDTRIRVGRPQMDVLLYVLASQFCRMDDPQYGYLILSGMPTGEDDEWIVEASMHRGDFRLYVGDREPRYDYVSGEGLAKRSISAAVNFPDIDLHYTQTVSGKEELRSGIYFDDELSVLVLKANHGQLLLSLQVSYTEDGEAYERERLLEAYAAATLVFQYMTPGDDVLRDSCEKVLTMAYQRYSVDTCGGDLSEHLDWVRGVFERERQPETYQWKLWKEEHPDVKSFFAEE